MSEGVFTSKASCAMNLRGTGIVSTSSSLSAVRSGMSTFATTTVAVS
ncbi:MAG: hypothetical protein NTX64_16960 [Elusimicrobia bacterium]|nr:hypothetical protein [Elusimicrobiota bacterium]